MTKAESSSTLFSLNQSERWVNEHANHVIRSRLVIGEERDHQLEWALMCDEDGDTPLHISVAKGDEVTSQAVVNILKSRHVTLDIKNELLQTPLHLAVITDNQPLLALLINASPSSLTVGDRHGNNAAHLAVKYCTNSATLKTVFDACSLAALEAKNIFGLAPMHLAAIENKKDSILLLKRSGADINILDNKGGATPIILAARASHKEAAQALLELGANPNLRTTFGESASQVASSNGDRGMSELLSLFDNPYDGSRSGQRYVLDRIRSNESVQQFQESSKHHIKPFVSTTRAPMSLPPNSLRHQHMTSSQPTQISPVCTAVKRETQTPTQKAPFPKQDPHARTINPFLPSSISQHVRMDPLTQTQRVVYPNRYPKTLIPTHSFHYPGRPLYPMYLPTTFETPSSDCAASSTAVSQQQQRPKRKLVEPQNEPLDLSSTVSPKRSRKESKPAPETTNNTGLRDVMKKEATKDWPNMWLPNWPTNHSVTSLPAPKQPAMTSESRVTSLPNALPVTSPQRRAPVVYRQPSVPERRIYSDDLSKLAVQTNEERPLVVRRNSAPVDNVKVHDKRRLDLHSYRGCLPPHLLHLLESSGNLPTQSSNVLKKVSTVFPQEKVDKPRHDANKMTSPCQQKRPSPLKPPPASSEKSRDDKSPKRGDVVNVSPKHAQQSTAAQSSSGEKQPSVTSQNKSVTSQSVGDMKAWHSFDSGNFPAFGQCFSVTGKLPNNGRESGHVMVNRHQTGSKIFRNNSKSSVSHKTKRLLENATEKRSPTKSTLFNVALPTVLCACANEKHSCAGCSRGRHKVTSGNMVLEDIWKGKSERRYVTSSSGFKPTLVSSSQRPVNFPSELKGKINDVATKFPTSSNLDVVVMAANMTSSVKVGFVHTATVGYNKNKLSAVSEPDCVSEDSGTDTIEEIGDTVQKQRSQQQQKQPEKPQEIRQKRIDSEIQMQEQKQKKLALENNIKIIQQQNFVEEQRQKLQQKMHFDQLQKNAELNYRSQQILEAERNRLYRQFEMEQRLKFEENILRRQHQQLKMHQERFEKMQKFSQLQHTANIGIQLQNIALLQQDRHQLKSRETVAYSGSPVPPARTRKNSLDAKLDQRKHKALNEHQLRYEQTRNYEFSKSSKNPTPSRAMNGLSTRIDDDMLANEIQDSDDEIEDKIAHSSAQLAAKMNRHPAPFLKKMPSSPPPTSLKTRPTVLKSLNLSKSLESDKIANGIKENREIISAAKPNSLALNCLKKNLTDKTSASLRFESKKYTGSKSRADDINLCDLEISEDESEA